MSVVLPVQVRPAARQTRLVGRYGDGIKVQVAAPPEKGQANRALCRFLAELLAVPAAAVTVATGDTGRRKRVKVDGLDAATLWQRLAAAGAA